MRIAIAVLVLLALATNAWAGDLSLKPEKMQVSGVVGTLGVGAAVYWPVINLEGYGLSVGPMLGLGSKAAAVGAGLKLSINLEVEGLNIVNFGWVSYEYNWESASTGWGGGFGHSWVAP